MGQAQSAAGRVVGLTKKPLVRRTLLGLLVAIVLFGVIGYFVLPGIVKNKAEELIGEKLHRKTTIEAVEIQPYSLEATIRGVKMMEPDGTAVFVSFDELYVDIEAESLFRAAPVVREVRLLNPYVHMVRLDGQRFNFSDIVGLIKSQPPSDEPARFSINNILIDAGRIEFDDRPDKVVHTVEQLKIGIPFVSNLQSHVEVYVEPALSAKVDGAPLALVGKARPFRDTQEASIDLDYDGVDLTRFYNYFPFKPGFKLPAAKLDLHLNAIFQQPKDAPPRLVVKGTGALKSVVLTTLEGSPLVRFAQLDLALASADLQDKRIDVSRIALHSPEVDVVRGKAGEINLLKLAPPPQTATPDVAKKDETDAGQAGPAPKSKTPKVDLRVAEIVVDGAVIRLADEVPAKPFKATIDKLDITVRQFSLPGATPATVELSAHSAAGETIRHDGQFTLQPLQASGSLQAAGIALTHYLPHYVPQFAGELDKGTLVASAKYTFAAAAEGLPQIKVTEAAATLSDLALRLPGEKRPVVTVETFSLANAAIDPGLREIRVGEISSKNAHFSLIRNKDGSLNLERMVAKSSANDAAAPNKAQPPAPAESRPGKPFTLGLGRLDIDKWSARVEDQTMARPVVTLVEPISLKAQELSTLPGARAKVDIRAQINKKGALAAAGSVGASPLHANLKLDLKGVDALPLQPYFTDRVNILLIPMSVQDETNYGMLPDVDNCGSTAWQDLGRWTWNWSRKRRC